MSDSFDVFINVTGPAHNVTLNTNITIDSLTINSSDATFLHTGGTLALGGNLAVTSGDYHLSGGTISSANIIPGGNFIFLNSSGNIFSNNAIFNGDVNLDTSSATLRLQSGASFTGDANLTGSNARLAIQDTTTLTGKTINLDGANARLGIEGTNILTFGTGTLVRGRGNVGSATIVGGTSSLFNDSGTIRADLTGQTLTINPNNFTNQAAGTVEAINGATLILATSTNVAEYTGTALTGGIWRVFENSTLRISTSGTGLVTNNADITLSGANSVLQVGNSNATIDTRLTTNTGALRILDGRSFNAPDDFNNSGTIQIGGGSFNAPELNNSANILGHGHISVRPVNSGTIRSEGGTLTLSDGIQGGGGTVQIELGSTLDLSAGAASGSSAAFLAQNGNLMLGSKNFSVGSDYTNANFGVGNTFSPRAMVSGSGGILGVGGIAQALIGDVSGGAGATPVLDFGNLHIGASPTLAYQIRNTGGSGASLRGAVQTVVNGGNLTDSRLSGTGVMAANLGPIAPGDNTAGLAVTFNATDAGALAGQTVTILNNFDNVANQTLSITGAAYRLAAPSTHSPGPVHFGNFHVGQSEPSQALALTNDVPDDGFSESLDASISSATGGVTSNGGSFAALAPGATNSSALSVGINTESAGSKNGDAIIALTSNGAGSSSLGMTIMPSQTVTVTGAVYRLAQPLLPDGALLDFGTVHVGDVVQQAVPVTNATAADGYSEALDGSFSGSTGSVTTSGSFSALVPDATSSEPLIMLDTSTAGSKSGTATLAFASNGTGSSGLGNTTLTPQVITASAEVNHYAQPVFSDDSGAAELTGEGNAYTLDFGRRTIGETPPSVTLRLINAAPAPADTLAGDYANDAPDFQFTGFGAFSGIDAGQYLSDLVIALKTESLGTFNQTITLNALSENDSGYSGALAPIVITLTGEVAEVPTLKVREAGAYVILSWPLAEQDWVLRQGSDLIGWTEVTEPVIETPSEHTVTVPRLPGRMFFRLEK